MVHFDTPMAHYVAKELDLFFGTGALRWVEVKLMNTNCLKDLFKVAQMLLYGKIVDQDVIEIYHHKFI